ncbi:hypothetical protein [Leptospira sp. GIMC2001]|uniref:hypothetical protein n=1 Tax=Leptospira sp. GIMC2001 TaxID=1513297 RepID=UPI00234AF493|nr:hypothetical protein [Leptospira sp. GIMC2001]WCL50524.1 hypothetical protein O4O04_06810 [Leptospira sp. GIMC2001]
MRLSKMQLKLIQESKMILVNHLNLTNDEAISVISKALRRELVSRKITMETLEISTLSVRTSFVRSVVKGVQDEVMKNPKWKSDNVERYIGKFYQSLYKSMNPEPES